jgi:hypothetical protein
MENQNVSLLYRNRIYGLGNASDVERLYSRISGYGNFFIWVFLATIPGLFYLL